MSFFYTKSHSRKRFLSFFLITTCLSLFFSGCTKSVSSTNANAAFDHYTEAVFQQEVSSTTIGLHYTLQNPEDYGIIDPPVTYGSFQQDTTATLAALENTRAFLNDLSYSDLSKDNQLTYDVLSSYLETAIKGAPLYLYSEPLSPITGIHAQLPVLLAEYQLHTNQDILTYLELLRITPKYFDSLIEFEREKSERGLFMSDTILNAVMQQCEAFLNMGDANYLFSTFENRLKSISSLSDKDITKYLEKNRTCIKEFVLPAYQHLLTELQALQGSGLNDGGLCGFPEGKKYYSYLVERDTGSSKPVSEIKQAVHNQITSDMLSIQSIIKSNPGLSKETFSLQAQDPSVLLGNLKEDISSAFPKPPEVTTRIKYVPEALEPYLSPAFYMIPSIDNTSENIIYLNKSRNMEELHLFTTLAHEGYPGHLYQTTYYANQNHNPLRNILDFGGYTEGWATYAEMCSYYLTPLDKAEAFLRQKNSSVILGLYSVADIGIHYDGWAFEDMVTQFSKYGIEDEKSLKEIYDLIIGDPANYLKYYVGYIEFLELKKEAAIALGNSFSQKAFHKAVLDVGPAPFKIVKKYALK